MENIVFEVESWFFMENGVVYWEWRNSYKKLLGDICRKRFATPELDKDVFCPYCNALLETVRQYKNHDKRYVEEMKNMLHSCQLWLEEMRNPVKASYNELKRKEGTREVTYIF